LQLNNIFSIFFLSFLFLSIFIKILLDVINYLHRKKNEKTIPNELSDMVDQEKLIKINKYSNAKLKFSLVEYFFDNVILILILFLGIIPFYYNFLAKFTGNIYFIGILFFGGYFALQFILGIPFSLYFNFVIEKKFGFNKMTFGLWIGDLFKEIIISAVIGVILLVPLIFFIESFPNIWWLLVWSFILIFSLVMQIIYPSFIAPLFNKFKALSNEVLKDKIESLLKDSGFKSDGVFEMDASKRSSHSNAYFTGFGKTKRIVLFDSLLKNHSDDEILAILAHEIGHFKYKHVLKGLVFSSITILAGLFISYLLIDYKLLYDAFYINTNVKIIGLFLISIIAGPAGFFFTPVSSSISRKHEYQADNFAKGKMGSPVPLITSLKKLNVDNLSNLYPHDAYVWFYYSHPPLFKRIRALEK